MVAIHIALAMILTMLGVLLVIPILFLALPFWGVSGATRAITGLIRPKVLPWQQLIEYEPTVGWKPKSNLDAYANADGVFRLTTDAEGWRGPTSLEESEIVVFGDSFAFGYGADDKKFYAGHN